ncbi:hypothetical protein RvY_13875 [Ramazzottius varieornatus]|uniref:Uncharacterized protein n=1 Tax=Ramazzottius varieornatus TaxID=947166 RepID=A0A1D1VPE6_RAMVA|nr:hypothetical protein RvY_13875 [Ramazzottius varieornatus]
MYYSWKVLYATPNLGRSMVNCTGKGLGQSVFIGNFIYCPMGSRKSAAGSIVTACFAHLLLPVGERKHIGCVRYEQHVLLAGTFHLGLWRIDWPIDRRSSIPFHAGNAASLAAPIVTAQLPSLCCFGTFLQLKLYLSTSCRNLEHTGL